MPPVAHRPMAGGVETRQRGWSFLGAAASFGSLTRLGRAGAWALKSVSLRVGFRMKPMLVSLPLPVLGVGIVFAGDRCSCIASRTVVRSAYCVLDREPGHDHLAIVTTLELARSVPDVAASAASHGGAHDRHMAVDAL